VKTKSDDIAIQRKISWY